VATATHGSGDRSGNLATAVAGLELITSNGELLRIARGSPGFDGVVVGLGAVGAVARVTLDVEPAYQVRQRVFERLSWGALFDHFDQITSSGDSVSLFTDWGPTVDQVWVKTRVRSDAAESPDADFFGAIAATVDRHPIAGMDPVNCTPQLGRPGSWWERLPHFRIGFTPSSGDELQSEYLVPRQHALSAIDALRRMADRIRLLLQVSEIRTVAADQLWMSPQYGRDTVGIHFTWLPRPREVERLLGEIESVLARFEARPHWGKLFLATAGDIAALYERLPDFLRLVEQLDPRGAFRNAWFDARLRGTA
jgi:xylitol oxidase